MKRDLRQFKKQQAREALFNAALDLFFKKGFEQTTVDEIADQAVVSRRTFFRYYASKEDVLVAWMDDMGLRMQEDLRANLGTGDPFTALQAAMMRNADALTADMDSAIALARLSFRTPAIRSHHGNKYTSWEKGFSEILCKGKTSAKAHLEARLLAARAIDALRISLDMWVEGDFKADIRALLLKAFQTARQAV
jgi:AcrR family transcriptional regulator